MNKGDKGRRKSLATSFNVSLAIACLPDKRMHMKCICDRDQEIEDYHIMRISSEPERENHQCVDWNAIGRQCDRNITDLRFVIDAALPLHDNELVDLGEKDKCN